MDGLTFASDEKDLYCVHSFDQMLGGISVGKLKRKLLCGTIPDACQRSRFQDSHKTCQPCKYSRSRNG